MHSLTLKEKDHTRQQFPKLPFNTFTNIKKKKKKKLKQQINKKKIYNGI